MSFGPLDAIGSIFAGKGIIEHLVGAADGDPVAILGLQADAVGVGQMVAEQVLTRTAPREVAAIATPIINGGLLAINGMQLLCGLTFEQDKGEKFTNGSTAMQTVGKALGAAFPQEWQSDGATAYARQNTSQQRRADAVARTDRTIQGIIEQQAGQVKTTKDALDIAATVLTAAIPVVLATRAIPPPPVGVAAAEAIEIGATAGALATCGAAMGAMTALAAQNAGRISSAAAEYERVATEAKPAGASSNFDPPPTTGRPPGTNGDAPPATTPSGPGTSGGGAPSGGGGGAPSGGGGTPNGGGDGAPTAPAMPATPTAPSMPTMPATPAGGASGGGMGGSIGSSLAGAMASAMGGLTGGSSGSGASGGQGGIASAIAQTVSTAIQAGQQAEQQRTEAEAASKVGESGAGSNASGERAPVDSATRLDREASASMRDTSTNQPLGREREQR